MHDLHVVPCRAYAHVVVPETAGTLDALDGVVRELVPRLLSAASPR